MPLLAELAGSRQALGQRFGALAEQSQAYRRWLVAETERWETDNGGEEVVGGSPGAAEEHLPLTPWLAMEPSPLRTEVLHRFLTRRYRALRPGTGGTVPFRHLQKIEARLASDEASGGGRGGGGGAAAGWTLHLPGGYAVARTGGVLRCSSLK